MTTTAEAGRKGGKRTSAAKREAAARNLIKARAAMKEKSEAAK
jgi:hypothetical protein